MCVCSRVWLCLRVHVFLRVCLCGRAGVRACIFARPCLRVRVRAHAYVHVCRAKGEGGCNLTRNLTRSSRWWCVLCSHSETILILISFAHIQDREDRMARKRAKREVCMHMLSFSLTHTHTHNLSLSHTHTHTLARALSLARSVGRSLSLSHTHSVSLSLSLSLPFGKTK
jgi:hypothetical protein